MSLLGVSGIASGFAQSALDPAGPQAARIARLGWALIGISTVVFVLVIAALIAGLLARRSAASTLEEDAGHHLPPEGERRRTRTVAVATGITVAFLLGILVASVSTGRALASLTAPQALTIEVVGHQWWWEVHYLDPTSAGSFVTANELHIPVGKPILVRALGRDVIHSLWIPNLHGKRDLIPGHSSVIWLQADRPGLYRGQCAEFCGWQHAHMALDVYADTPDRFAAWVAAQRQPAPAPSTPLAQHGEQVFLAAPCPLCHTIQGTGANGQNAPDLTHLASRRTLAAGALPNTRDALAGWISDPTNAKPGVHMPATSLDPGDREALLSYLETLR